MNGLKNVESFGEIFALLAAMNSIVALFAFTALDLPWESLCETNPSNTVSETATAKAIKTFSFMAFILRHKTKGSVLTQNFGHFKKK